MGGPPSAAESSPGMSRRFVVLLGLLTALTPMSIDMYLPSLPTLERAFATDSASVQLTLAAFFIGLALGQAFYGPFTDRFGRKTPLCVGLAVYAVASAGCALAARIETLIAWRFVQALGGCAGLVIPRAMVRDVFDHQASARVFSLLLLVMGAAPILAPLVGGQLLVWLGWRAIFVTLALAGLAGLVAALIWLRETRPATSVAPPGLGDALRGYLRLLADRRYLGYTFTAAFSMAGMFAYIAGSPFVFIDLYGVPPSAYGWLFGLNAFGLIAASQVNNRLLVVLRADLILSRAIVATAALAVGVFVLAVTRVAGLVGLLVPLFGFMASLGFIQPNAVAGALAGHPQRAGRAAALLGTVQFTAATLTGALVGMLHDGTAVPLAAVVAGCGVLALAAHRRLVGGERGA